MCVCVFVYVCVSKRKRDVCIVCVRKRERGLCLCGSTHAYICLNIYARAAGVIIFNHKILLPILQYYHNYNSSTITNSILQYYHNSKSIKFSAELCNYNSFTILSQYNTTDSAISLPILHYYHIYRIEEQKLVTRRT